MSETKPIPKFKSDEEEVEFWDSLDTAQILEEGEETELEYKPEPEMEDICSRFLKCKDKINLGDRNGDKGKGEI